MHFKQHHKTPNNTPHHNNKCKATLDLDQARRLHKSNHQALSKEKRRTITNEISVLENVWKKMRVGKDLDESQSNHIPRTKIFLATTNPSAKTIAISTASSNLSQSSITKLLDISPSRLTASKWKKQAKTPSMLESNSKEEGFNKCISPIKKYLDRFREITKQTQMRPASATMEIEQILFRQNR